MLLIRFSLKILPFHFEVFKNQMLCFVSGVHSIAMITTDSLYNFFKVLSRTVSGFYYQFQTDTQATLLFLLQMVHLPLPKRHLNDQCHIMIFLKDQILHCFALKGCMTIAAIYHHDPHADVPLVEVVIHFGCIPLLPDPGLLRCLWLQPHQLFPCFDYWEACHFNDQSLGQHLAWRNHHWLGLH